MNGKILADSIETLCPVCLNRLKGSIIENEQRVYLHRSCPSHGDYSLLISNHPDYYRQLRDYYFSTISDKFKQSRYLLFVTEKCNLNCPICFYGNSRAKDLSAVEVEKIINSNKGSEMVIFGKEATCSNYLQELIKLIKKRQSSLSLYTNGIKIADKDFLSKIKKSGVDKIYLQFDGFKGEINKEFRHQDNLAIKLEALDNLKRENISTVLDVTIAKDKNEDQIEAILEYALCHNFIRTLNFISYVRSGKGSTFLSDNSIMPDQLIDIIERQTAGKISRNSVFLFQKFFLAYMSLLKRRTCFYVQYYWILRQGNSFTGIESIIDLKGMQAVLDRYKALVTKHGLLARIYLILNLPRYLLNFKSFRFMQEFIRAVFSHIFKIGEYSKISPNFIQIIFTTACDPYKADSEISKRCHVGFIYKDSQGKIRKFNENSKYLLDNEIALGS